MAVGLPALSIGVITTDQRTSGFAKLLEHLVPAVTHYAGDCELVVCNNTGASTHAAVQAAVDASALGSICPCTVFDSPRNNIATGRNVVLENRQHDLLVFIDDDEYPSSQWLSALVEVRQQYQCNAVAGPIIPVFDASAPAWVRHVDVHNANGLSTGDSLVYAASGNVLLDRECTNTLRFDEAYGRTGGSDTEYFLRLHDAGATLRWASDALVHEDIPANRSTARYTLKRCLIQGQNYRRIRQGRNDIGSRALFLSRALMIFLLSLPIGLVLLLAGHAATGIWLKRAFSNLGKLYSPRKLLYG